VNLYVGQIVEVFNFHLQLKVTTGGLMQAGGTP